MRTYLKKVLFALFAGAAVYFFVFSQTETKGISAISTAVAEVGDFVLLDHKGDIHKLYLNSNAKAIVLIGHGNSCPIVQKYSKKIHELNEKYSKQGFVFLMIDPSRQSKNTRDELIMEAKKYDVKLPILMDTSQIVTKSLGMTRTSEVVVITPSNWKIAYRGAIDDRIGFEVDKQVAKNNYLSDALDKIAAGKPIDFKPSPAKGCAFTFFEPQEQISYTKIIAPIVAEKCLNCHTDKGKFPPNLDSYEKLRNWSAMIKETLFTDRMPPFSADLHYGNYKNDLSLSADEKRLLVQWIDADLPRDNENDPLAEAHRKSAAKKRNNRPKITSNPIYEASMPYAEKIPPGGMLEYNYYQLGGPIPHDMWISGMEVVTDNPRQLHHETLLVTSKPLAYYENMARDRNTNEDEKYLESSDGVIPFFVLNSIRRFEKRYNPSHLKIQVWAAGRRQPFGFPKDVAAFFPKGHYLILQTHYMGTGIEESEQTKIKFFGSSKKPKGTGQLRTEVVIQMELNVPPGAKKYSVTTDPYFVKQDIELLSLQGHMHMRGRATKLIETDSNGKSRVLASIPNYYYKWQVGASLQPNPPLVVKAGSQLTAVCEYDNSAENPNNPDPTKLVRTGQRVDRSEMCHFNLGVVYRKDRF